MALDIDPSLRCGAGWRESCYTPDLGAAICERVAAGATLRDILAEPGMPDRKTVWNWSRAEPEFARDLAAAQANARRTARLRTRARMAAARARALANPRARGGLATTHYTEELGREICRRLENGESLKAIGRDPAMPCYATIYHWLERFPEFEEMYVRARQRQADTLLDEAREVALGATRESVWADRLRFDTIRWMTARLAPRKYVERLVVAQVSAEIAEESSDRIKTIKIIRFERSPDGEEVLAIPPRNAEEEARWERAYGRPYDGPR
jgi:hypothetical protein